MAQTIVAFLKGKAPAAFDARQIMDGTGINPYGEGARCRTLLKNLVDNRVIERTSGSPFLYWVKA